MEIKKHSLEKRPFFFKAALLVFSIFFFLGCSQTQEKGTPLGRLPILQGATGDSSTQFGILVQKDADYHYMVKTQEGQTFLPQKTRLETFPESDEAIQKLFFTDLPIHSNYQLIIQEKNGRLIDQRAFKLLQTKSKRFKMAFVSCLDDSYPKKQAQIWTELTEKKPDLIFFLGDNVYADKGVNFYKGPADPPMLWKRYLETRKNLDFFRQKRLIPVLATWDDHDFGQDNGDQSYPHRKTSQKIFSQFFPQDSGIPQKFQRGPGVSSYFYGFGQHFYLMDGRSFRSPKLKKDGLETHWGREQENWLVKQARKTKGPIWILNGDQIFGNHHSLESYQRDHPKSFQQTIKKLQKLKGPIVFVSGDLHRSEIQRIPKRFVGYETFEFTSSPLHAYLFPPEKWSGIKSPYEIFSFSKEVSYFIVESQQIESGLDLNVAVWTLGNEKVFSQKFKVRSK